MPYRSISYPLKQAPLLKRASHDIHRHNLLHCLQPLQAPSVTLCETLPTQYSLCQICKAIQKNLSPLLQTFITGRTFNTAEAAPQQILLAGPVSRRGRLAHLYLVKQLANVLVVLVEAFTLENLDQKITTWT